MTRLTDARHPISDPGLEGGINFRSLGGLPAADGRSVKHGLLFRAGDLNGLSEQDCVLLSDIPLRVILDYRDAEECRARPDKLWSGVSYQAVPANPEEQLINGNLEKLTTDILADIDAKAWMTEFYRQLPFANPAYRNLAASLVSQPDGAIVQHCAFGKDRTGVGSALVLLALGAEEDTIMEDYILTELRLAPYREKVIAEHSNTLSGRALQQFSYLLQANPDFLRAALQAIDERYGSPAAWLAHDYRLDSECCARLRHHYLSE